MFSPKWLCQPWGERFVGTFLAGVMGLILSPDSGQPELSPGQRRALWAGVCERVCTCTRAVCGGTRVSKA